MQSKLVISYDERDTASTSYTPGYYITLFDADGDALEMSLGIANDDYFSGAFYAGTGGGASSWAGKWFDLTVADTSQWFTRTYVIDGIGTANGSVTVNGNAITDTGNASGTAIVFDLSSVGEIVEVEINVKKYLEVDNLSIDIPEPASMVLLGMGGLGMLIRRKR